MVYGIICFGTLFSLVGTILGGIWADQSWGRFWG
jgi:ABC-type transport system involved in cytochrome c biogenesis permease subunit